MQAILILIRIVKHSILLRADPSRGQSRLGGRLSAGSWRAHFLVKCQNKILHCILKQLDALIEPISPPKACSRRSLRICAPARGQERARRIEVEGVNNGVRTIRQLGGGRPRCGGAPVPEPRRRQPPGPRAQQSGAPHHPADHGHRHLKPYGPKQVSMRSRGRPAPHCSLEENRPGIPGAHPALRALRRRHLAPAATQCTTVIPTAPPHSLPTSRSLAYAALSFNRDLGFNAKIYSMGTALFYLSFMLFMVGHEERKEADSLGATSSPTLFWTRAVGRAAQDSWPAPPAHKAAARACPPTA
jgi:hypothetical protein